jgi:glutamine synthetase
MTVTTAEYIWLGGNNEFRSKTRTITLPEENWENPDLYEKWNYDGSSTEQARGDDSEVILKPGAVFKDPFKTRFSVLVLCETYTPDGKPLPNNHRHNAVKLFNQKLDEKPWYGIEQEFYLMDGKKPYNSETSMPALGLDNAEKQGQYYCSVGSNNAFGRDIADYAYEKCLEAGLKVSGMNAEVGPGQWEIQVGPCEGIESGDHLQMCRYILHRTSELYNVQVNFDPKPLKGDWNGSGCHTNYSTEKMRQSGGMDEIISAINKLSLKHAEHMQIYGDDNHERCTGLHETASFEEFSYGVANRGASVRIPRTTEEKNCGYFEDRRPGSNMDPYLVTSKIFETTVLDN